MLKLEKRVQTSALDLGSCSVSSRQQTMWSARSAFSSSVSSGSGSSSRSISSRVSSGTLLSVSVVSDAVPASDVSVSVAVAVA